MASWCVCMGRGQLNGGPFKEALKCLCLQGTKLTAQLLLHDIIWTVRFFKSQRICNQVA